MTLLSNIFWILHLVISQWTQLLLIMDKKIMQKFHFKIWRCNVSKPKPVTQTDRLWEIQRKSIIKTVCRDVLVFYYIYLTPVKKFESSSCGMWWDIRMLKVSLYPLHCSFKTLGGWVIRFNTEVQELPTQILSLYLLNFFDCKHQKPIVVKQKEILLEPSWGAQNGKASSSQA